jgi:hypothetical protein
MKRIFLVIVLISFSASLNLNAQELPQLKLKSGIMEKDDSKIMNSLKSDNANLFQVKKRKAVNMYFGAGYSFVIFTSSQMNNLYPIFNQSSGDFLSEINLFFGLAVAKAVTIEFEPSILFTNNNKSVYYNLIPARYVPQLADTFSYSATYHVSMLAFPLALNARFFPFYKMDKSFIRLFFVGAGAGVLWVREEYDNTYGHTPPYGGYYYSTGTVTESTSQWAPIFRVMTGFTGSGGMFGFGGELRFNIVPLKTSDDPFATRQSKNFNSVDLALRFYFSL